MLLLKTLAPWLLLAFLGLISPSSGARNKNRGKFTTKDNMQCTWGAKMGDPVRLSVRCEDQEARSRGGESLLQCEYEGRPQGCPGYFSNNRGFWRHVTRAFKKLQGKLCRDDRALVKADMCRRAPLDAHFKLDTHSSVVSAVVPRLRTTTTTTTSTTTSTTSTTTTAAAPSPRSVSASAPPNATACAKRADHRKTAEEHCSGAWASVCSFFLSMLQSEDC